MPMREWDDTQPPGAEPSRPGTPRPSRVLLAEDDETISAAVRISLQLDGLELLRARDGAEAVQLGCKHEFDLILVDLDLPVLTGLEVCQKLRDCPHLAAVPILVMTTHHDPRRVLVGSRPAHVNGYLAKPFKVAE